MKFIIYNEGMYVKDLDSVDIEGVLTKNKDEAQKFNLSNARNAYEILSYWRVNTVIEPVDYEFSNREYALYRVNATKANEEIAKIIYEEVNEDTLEKIKALEFLTDIETDGTFILQDEICDFHNLHFTPMNEEQQRSRLRRNQNLFAPYTMPASELCKRLFGEHSAENSEKAEQMKKDFIESFSTVNELFNSFKGRERKYTHEVKSDTDLKIVKSRKQANMMIFKTDKIIDYSDTDKE